MSEWPFGDLKRKHYGAILADPPWRFETYNEAGRSRSPDWKRFKGSPSKHYDTMAAEEIAAPPVADVASDNSCLFLWISWPMLPHAMSIISAWGFVYKTCAFAWMKAHIRQPDIFRDDADALMGTGYWTRANSEVCLLATRGKPKRLHADVRQGIIAPRLEHSRKPDGVHERIERLIAGPYCELFARQKRPRWDAWGNETEKFRAVS